MKLKKIVLSMLGASALMIAGQASATAVGLELMLLVDVSGSVNSTEYGLQKTGYVNAFNSAAVQNAIMASQGGAIAVTYIEWSGQGQISSQVAWTLINSAATASSFATSIAGTTRAYNGSTAIQNAMYTTRGWFGDETRGTANGFESMRQVIDVSGDGADNNTGSCNVGSNAACGRDAALSDGVDTINGIYILGEGGLAAYYNANVKGGTGGFAVAAANFADFGTAIENKLVREISNVPEPTSLALVGIALAGAGMVRRRTAKKS